MYFTRNPKIVRLIYPDLIWQIAVKEKLVFLTFDDGPDPKATIDALELLARFNAKATFFCVGEKVIKYPEIVRQIVAEGHTIGNHSHKHLKGKKTADSDYFQDVMNADKLIRSKLFRPPYGSITREQIRLLKDQFKIIMWSVLPGDFDQRKSKEVVLNRCIRNTKPGDIVVLHDNPKFYEKMIYALEGMLEHFTKTGFKFVAINDEYL